METIGKFTYTQDIAPTIEPTIKAFSPLLEAKRSEILDIPTKTFKYGSTDRHQLDIYYPLTAHPSGKTQVLFFIYGGGFVSGERRFPPPLDLCYTCVAAFFARRGFLVIIPDYRLAPATTFPGPIEDVCDAIIWATKNPNHLTTPTTPHPDTDHILLMGHSAGSAHAVSTLLLPHSAVLPKISGLILWSGAYKLNDLPLPQALHDIAIQYFGGEQGLVTNSPIGLLRSASDAIVAALPRIALVVAQNEPPWLLVVNDEFKLALEARTGKSPTQIVALGHNHVSLPWCLGTGEGEKFAEEIISWIGE